MKQGITQRIFGDPIFKRVLRNMSWLFSAHMLIALFGVMSLAVTARALGPEGLGILAIVEAYVRIVDRLLRFEPWQAVIRYGVDALENNDEPRFKRLVKLSIVTDLIGGALSGSVAIALSWTLAPWIGLTENGHLYTSLVALGLYVSFRPTGVAVLRIFDRFDSLAKIDTFAAAFRLTLAVLAYYLGLGLWAFLGILLVQRLIDGLLALLVALRELRLRGFHHVLNASAFASISENKGFLRFLCNSNVNVIFRQSTQRIDVIILGALLDAGSVGFFQIAKRSADAALRFGRPLSQALYPEIARLWAKREVDRFVHVVARTTALVSIFAIAGFIPIAMNMEYLVTLFFGREFAGAATLVTLQGIASIVYLGGIVLNPTMLSMGRDKELVMITVLCTTAFAVCFVPLVQLTGVAGASISHLIFNLFWFSGCMYFLIREKQKFKKNSEAQG